MGHTLAAVLGGVLGVLAVISVFTIAVIFGMLGTSVYRGVVEVVGVVGVALFRTRSLLVPGFFTDIFSTYTYLQCIQPFLLL